MPPLGPGHRYGCEQVLDAIDAAYAAIEIVTSRFRSHEGAPRLDRLADNISNAGLVISAPCRDWRSLALSALPLRFTLEAGDGNAQVHEAHGGAPLNDPLLPLLWLANHLSERGIGLHRGDIVTTGSWAGMPYLGRGGRAVVQFGGLGSVELALA